MDCGGTKDLIARSVSGNATSSDEAALRAHAGACPACAAAFARARKLWDLMGRLPAAAPARDVDPLSLIRPRRQIWGPATAVAAVLMVAVTLGIVLRPGPAPTEPTARSTPEVAPSPEQDRVERVLDAVVREERRSAPPRPPEKAPEPEAKELPVVVRPEPPAPPAPPEKKPEPPPAPAPVVKAPEPAPAVEPSAPKPALPSRETLPTAATLERAEGAVFAMIGGERKEVLAPFRLTDADGLATLGKNSQAVLAYEDGTRLVLGADSELGRVLRRTPGEVKRVEIARGTLAAQVGRRSGDDPLVFGTPHADARVLGTRLILLVSEASTRLDVKEGRVKLIRKDDGASVDVNANQYAIAGKGMSMSARAIPGPKIAVREDFERGRWSPAWAAVVDQSQGITVAAQAGALLLGARSTVSTDVPGGLQNDPGALKKQFEQVQRTSALAPKKDWARAGALESKAGFAYSNDAPLRVRLHAWTAKAGAERMVWVGLNRGTPGQGISLERRGDVLRIWVDGAAAALWEKSLPTAKEWESLELWLGKERLALRRNGLTLAVLPHPLKGKTAQVTLGICAKAELAEDEETRIDDLEVAWVSPSDFEQISR